MDLERKIRNAKINLVIALIIYGIGLFSVLGGVISGQNSIIECLAGIFVMVLLGLAFSNYKNDYFKAASYEKIAGIFILINLILNTIVAMILLKSLNVSNTIFSVYLSSIFSIATLINIVIAGFLICDGITITNMTRDTACGVSFMVYIAAIVIIIINIFVNGAQLRESVVSINNLNDLFSSMTTNELFEID